MNRFKEVKKFVEIALEHCGHKSELRIVRDKLSDVLKSIRKVELRETEAKKPTIQDKWTFDVKTSSLRNLSRNQFDNVIGRIENMINAESKKLKKDDSEEIFTE